MENELPDKIYLDSKESLVDTATLSTLYTLLFLCIILQNIIKRNVTYLDSNRNTIDNFKFSFIFHKLFFI